MPSAAIRAFSYRARQRELDIVFQTARSYTYFDVPPETHAGLKSASSKGEYFNRNIRGRYAFRRNADVSSPGAGFNRLNRGTFAP
jgi:hypothetical protein